MNIVGQKTYDLFNSLYNKIVPGVFENFNLFDFRQYTYRLFKLVLYLIIPCTVSHSISEGFYQYVFYYLGSQVIDQR